MSSRTIFAPVLTCSLLALAGCLGFLHPVPPPTKDEAELCLSVPTPARNRVYVFFLHGADPTDCANLKGLRSHVQDLGFIKTYAGEIYHVSHFAAEISRIHCDEPTSRFILIAQGLACGYLHDLAAKVGEKEITIDLALAINPKDGITSAPPRPRNILRILAIEGGKEARGETKADETILVPEAGHCKTISAPATLKTVAKELAIVAGRVPVVGALVPVYPGPVTPAQPGVLPPPIPLPQTEKLPAPKEQTSGKEWNFLQPDGRAGEFSGRSPASLAGEAPPATLTEE